MKLTPKQLAEIRVLALAATEGPWEAFESHVKKIWRDDEGRKCTTFLYEALKQLGANGGPLNVDAETNAAYIAAANPTAILAMTDHITALEAELDDTLTDKMKLWDAIPKPHHEESVFLAGARHITALEAELEKIGEFLPVCGEVQCLTQYIEVSEILEQE